MHADFKILCSVYILNSQIKSSSSSAHIHTHTHHIAYRSRDKIFGLSGPYADFTAV